jgi:hypothetical protein
MMYTLVQPGWHEADSLSHDHVSYVIYDVDIGPTFSICIFICIINLLLN